MKVRGFLFAEMPCLSRISGFLSADTIVFSAKTNRRKFYGSYTFLTKKQTPDLGGSRTPAY